MVVTWSWKGHVNGLHNTFAGRIDCRPESRVVDRYKGRDAEAGLRIFIARFNAQVAIVTIHYIDIGRMY